MRRNCSEVIDQIMVEIPKSETFLRAALEKNKKDAMYKPPEETIQWDRTSATLVKFIPIIVEDWHFKVLEIFTTRTRKEIEKAQRLAKK